MLEMLMCAALWSIAGIFIKLIPWNSFVISALRSLFAAYIKLPVCLVKRNVFAAPYQDRI